MSGGELADQLEAIAEALADLAFERLSEASQAAGRGATPDPAVLADERRLTRARRAVDKAVGILRAAEDGDRAGFEA